MSGTLETQPVSLHPSGSSRPRPRRSQQTLLILSCLSSCRCCRHESFLRRTQSLLARVVAHHSHSDALSAFFAMRSRHLVSRRCHTTSLTIFGESTLRELCFSLDTEPTSFVFSQFHDLSGRSNTRHKGCVHQLTLSYLCRSLLLLTNRGTISLLFGTRYTIRALTTLSVMPTTTSSDLSTRST